MNTKQLKDKILNDERNLERLMGEVETIWQDTGLDSKEPSYLIEKTMRFELAQKSIEETFSAIKKIIEDYKKLILELEKIEE